MLRGILGLKYPQNLSLEVYLSLPFILYHLSHLFLFSLFFFPSLMNAKLSLNTINQYRYNSKTKINENKAKQSKNRLIHDKNLKEKHGIMTTILKLSHTQQELKRETRNHDHYIETWFSLDWSSKSHQFWFRRGYGVCFFLSWPQDQT